MLKTFQIIVKTPLINPPYPSQLSILSHSRYLECLCPIIPKLCDLVNYGNTNNYQRKGTELPFTHLKTVISDSRYLRNREHRQDNEELLLDDSIMSNAPKKIFFIHHL